jgi:hypothetical protein
MIKGNQVLGKTLIFVYFPMWKAGLTRINLQQKKTYIICANQTSRKAYWFGAYLADSFCKAFIIFYLSGTVRALSIYFDPLSAVFYYTPLFIMIVLIIVLGRSISTVEEVHIMETFISFGDVFLTAIPIF